MRDVPLKELEAPQHSSPAENAAVLRGEECSDLASLYDPEVMVVTVPTAPGSRALEHADELLAADPREYKAEVHTPEGTPVPGALDRLALVGRPAAQAWSEYLGHVTGLFAHLVGAEVVGVRQMVADAPHCPRFHVDRVMARGVLNVVGACTEWLADQDLDRSRLGHAGGSDDAASGLVRRWDGLAQAECGTLAVFKGTSWPGAEERAVIHRSPPADGRRRLVLTLDWLD